ncbi:hypothetical protein TNCV_3907221 [Trichonephila clavipes]|nr:hypothetical protein TNCV_3907221 [Trichonephila clavipes]
MVRDESLVYFCTPGTGLAGYGIPRALYCTCEASSMITTITRSHTIGSFRMVLSQGFDVSKLVTTQAEIVAHLFPACTSVDPALLQRVHPSLPRHAQTCPDMHGRHFEHLFL